MKCIFRQPKRDNSIFVVFFCVGIIVIVCTVYFYLILRIFSACCRTRFNVSYVLLLLLLLLFYFAIHVAHHARCICDILALMCSLAIFIEFFSLFGYT